MSQVHLKPSLLPVFALGKQCCDEWRSGCSFSSVFFTLGDCSLPPDVPNAKPALEGHTSFPEKSVVIYKCDKDFVKIPGKPDAVICLAGNTWSEISEFCNRKFFISFYKNYENEMCLVKMYPSSE